MGDIVKFGSSPTDPGKIYYLTSTGGGSYAGSGTGWALTDKDAGGSTSGSIAIALGTNSSSDGMLLRGIAKLAADPGGSTGAPLYIGDDGAATNSAPGSGDFVRVIGYNFSEDGLIYFNPDTTTIEVA